MLNHETTKESYAMTIEQLQALLDSKKFHHATYRDLGTLWEGLMIYAKYDGLRGFEPVGVFPKNDPDLDTAYDILRGTGISFGAYGRG